MVMLLGKAGSEGDDFVGSARPVPWAGVSVAVLWVAEALLHPVGRENRAETFDGELVAIG